MSAKVEAAPWPSPAAVVFGLDAAADHIILGGHIVPRGLITLFVVLSASLTLNVVLGLKLRNAGPAPVAAWTISPGVPQKARLSGLPVIGADGAPKLLGFSRDRSTILYVFAPRCRYCAMNLANLKAVAEATKATHDFVAVSNTSAEFVEYMQATPMPGPAYVLDPTRLAAETPARYFDPTPQLVVVSPDGRVERVWLGVLREAAQTDVERHFGITLPGVVALNAAAR